MVKRFSCVRAVCSAWNWENYRLTECSIYWDFPFELIELQSSIAIGTIAIAAFIRNKPIDKWLINAIKRFFSAEIELKVYLLLPQYVKF